MSNKSSTPSLQLIQSKLEHFPPYISRYVHYKKIGNSVENTVSNYLIDFRTFFEWLCDEGYYSGEIREVPLSILEKLRLEDIQRFIEYRRSQEADRTVNRRLAALKDLFYYLSQLAEDHEGFPIMRRNVMAKVKLLKIDESESFRANQIHEKILHVNEQHNEVQEFLEFIRTGYPTLYPDNKKIQNFHQKNRERDIAILSLFLDSGLRAFELVGLNVDDVQFKGNFVFLHKGKGNKKDTVIFGDMAYVALKDYVAIREKRYGLEKDFPPLFVSSGTGPKGKPQRMTKRAIQAMVEKYAKAFEKPSLTVHKLRHTFATRFHQTNNDVVKLKRQLRHRSIQTTMIYTHVSDPDLKDAVVRTNDFTPRVEE
ncbi:hypothetical protein AM501_04370 [Aneurinibacillus migulanus]|uniref:tyrosine recombinase XerS n=1 Tax=Aneurinibacillus migulanus TaxID=47500 RepID=UPI0005B9B67A|nr:tyrosine recombinase XerS [Aneurinibacillus migulanus]KIV56490.1 hypothetical protein TS64_09535 [Aneurinibacillus migulanus]KPD09422.1 hypothetical protein AM501_04370 [Aneurinibacillus migulanus]CEH29103.1 Tyrosine recombinase xerS [Aneurinibacillus migulanus]